MPQILTALYWLFSLWMVADAVRKRAGLFWIVLILLSPPWGGLVYLVVVKVTEMRQGRLPGSSEAEPQQLSLGAKATTAASDPALDVADQLERQERFREAALIFRKALGQSPNNPRALHGLARCLTELGEGREALERFEALMEVDPRFRDYSAALEYAEALYRCDRIQDCIGMLRGLVEETGRINHRLALAHYLHLSGEREKACGVLREALRTYEESDETERISMSRWHRRVVDLLEDIAVS